MDNDMLMDPLGDVESENISSPKSLSEYDKLKMELEQELSMDLQAKEKNSNETSTESTNITIETQKPITSKTLENKKSAKSNANNNEKAWLSPSQEETAHSKKEKHRNLIVTIKIFDRGLVINGFREDTSLYTLSRAWMKNQKTNLAASQYNIFALLAAASKRQNNGQEILKKLQSGETKFICSMPAIHAEGSEFESSRVPSFEQLGFKQKPNIVALDDVLKLQNDNTNQKYLTSHKDLLAHHKLRWKKTKSNWIKHIRNNDKQYEVNFSILEILYKSQMKICPIK